MLLRDLEGVRYLARLLAQPGREFHVLDLVVRASGLAGRHRPVSATSERARASTTTRSVRYALSRIVEHHPELDAHLHRTIRTGTYCAHLPDPQAPTCWQL